MAEWNMAQSLNQALALELERDERVVVFGEDTGKAGGVFRVTEGLQARFGEKRVFDTPLAEAAIVGMACGMAANGLRPVPEIQFMGFILPAMSQVVGQVSRLHLRSGGRFAMSMVIRCPMGGLVRAAEIHSDSMEAYFVHTPGLKVVIPGSPAEAKGLFHAAMADPDPTIFMEPIKLYRLYREPVPEDYYTIPLGQARIVRPGRDVSLVTWGAMVTIALEAAEELAVRGIEVEVIDPRTLSPLDVETIVGSVRRTGRAVVVHEAPRTAGMGAEVVAVIAEHAFWSLLAPVERVTGWDSPYPVPGLEDFYVPNVRRIVAGIERVLAEGK